VSLQLQNGRVTLLARQAPIQQVLGEWARKGRTRIVNLERVAGPPLTLELKDLPEGKALAILLRSVAGYIAAPRAVPLEGASVYDRILILPTSNAAMAMPAARPRIPVAPPVLPDPTELANGEGEEPNAQDEQPADQQQRQPPVFIPPTPQPANQEPDSDTPTESPANPGVLPTPGITPGTAPGQFTTPTPGVLPPPPAAPPQPRQ
jgi:hypothetical protein